MPLLQVKDMPEDLYEKPAYLAKSENRSIARETIVLLRQALNLTQERMARRKQVLEEIAKLKLGKRDQFPDSAELIREDRDR